jgi:L-amino acid N-acyltransferase YncA
MTIQIRLARDSDVDGIAEIYRPIVESTTISFETVAPSREEMARRVQDTLGAYPWLVCALDGHVAGYAYAAKHRLRAAYQWSVDTSVYIHEGYRRRGIGRGLYESLFGILAAQGYFNAYAGIALPNPGSVALHESMGFEAIGVYRRVGYKLDRWCDVGWWQRSLQDLHRSPRQPRDLAAIARRSHWEMLVRRGESMVRTEVT